MNGKQLNDVIARLRQQHVGAINSLTILLFPQFQRQTFCRSPGFHEFRERRDYRRKARFPQPRPQRLGSAVHKHLPVQIDRIAAKLLRVQRIDRD